MSEIPKPFEIRVSDPLFDPRKPVTVNGFLFIPGLRIGLAHESLLKYGCGILHNGEQVFCDDERLPDSCRWYFCQCKRDARVVVEAIEELGSE